MVKFKVEDFVMIKKHGLGFIEEVLDENFYLVGFWGSKASKSQLKCHVSELSFVDKNEIFK